MSKLSQLQNDLKLAEQNKQNVIANKSTYTTTRTYTVSGPETFEKIVVPYEEMKHIWTPDERHPPDFPRPYLGDEDGRLSAFIAQKVGNSAIRVPKQGAYNMSCYGCGVVSYYLNDYGQQPPGGSNYHTPEQWNGTVKLYYYVQKQETRSEQVFSQSAYDSYLSSAQRKIDQIQQQINAENRHLALIKQQEQEQIAKQKIEQEKKEITAKIGSMSIQERIELLAEIFYKKDPVSQFTIKTIAQHHTVTGELSAHDLACVAIRNNDEKIFDLCLESMDENTNFNCRFSASPDRISNKTFIQYVIDTKNENLIAKAIAKLAKTTSGGLAFSFLEAIRLYDEPTIIKLLSHDANLLKEKYKGYCIDREPYKNNAHSILQIAIQRGMSIQVIKKILDLENDSISILSDDGRSAFKIACDFWKEIPVLSTSRLHLNKIIELLAQHINISQEVDQLAVDMHPSLKNAIAERKDIATLIKLLKGENVSAEEYLDIKEVVQVQHEDTDIYGTFDFGELNEEIQVAGSTNENVI